MTKYYDYKPIPKYKKGDMVYRCWSGIWHRHPEPISRVFVKEYNGKWYIEYYFPRERTPYDEDDLRATLEEQLKAEAKFVMNNAMSDLQGIVGFAEKHQIDLGAITALLGQLKLPKQ